MKKIILTTLLILLVSFVIAQEITFIEPSEGDKDDITTPVFDKLFPVKMNEGETVIITLEATDNNPVTFSSETLPPGATLEENIFTWTPQYDLVDKCWYGWLIRCRLATEVAFTASDGINSITQTQSITILESGTGDLKKEVEETISNETIEQPEVIDENVSILDMVDDITVTEVPTIEKTEEKEEDLVSQLKEAIEEAKENETIVEEINETEQIQEELVDYLNETVEDEVLIVDENTTKLNETEEELVNYLNETIIIEDNTTEINETDDLETVEEAENETIEENTTQVKDVLDIVEEKTEFNATQEIVLEKENKAPVILTIKPIRAKEGEKLEIVVEAEDPDGDAIFYSARNVPEESFFNENVFTWVPNYYSVSPTCWYTWFTTCKEEIKITMVASDGMAETTQDVKITILNSNAPPYIKELGDVSAKEGELVKVNITIVDIDKDVSKVTVSEPLGDDAEWQTENGDAGIYPVKISVFDKDHEAIRTFNLKIQDVDFDVIINKLVPNETTVTVEETEKIEFKADASDPDNSELTYLWIIDSEEVSREKTYDYEPGYLDQGEHELTLSISDGLNEKIIIWNITVENVAAKPVIEFNETIEVLEGETVNIVPKITDEDSNFTYSISGPVGADGIWETGFNDAGTYTVTIVATDGTEEVTKDVTIIVNNVNTATPTITTDVPQSITINEDEAAEFKADVTDEDQDLLSYTWYLDEYEVSSETEYVYGTSYDDAGQHRVKLVVSDGYDATNYTWNVTVANVNRAPDLSAITDLVIDEGDAAQLDLPEKDKDGDVIIYKISGELSDNKWITTNQDAGTHTFSVFASDGMLNDTINVTILVNDVNSAPEINEIQSASLNEGETIEFEVTATDEDKEPVRIYADELPAGATLINNTFSWTPEYNTVKAGTTKQEYEIKFKASDEKDVVTETMTITVLGVNRAPEIVEIEDITVYETEKIVIEPFAKDVDNDTLTFSYSGWMNSASKQTGYQDEGTYLVTVTVSDGTLTDSQGVVVTVLNKNRAPYFTKIEQKTVNENEDVVMRVKAKDFDGDLIAYKAENLPEDAEFNEDAVEWTPGTNVVKTSSSKFDKFLSKIPLLNKLFSGTSERYVVEFIASDDEDYGKGKGSITVKNVNQKPVIEAASPAPPILINQGDTVTFMVGAIDSDGDVLKYVWDFGLGDNYEGENKHTRQFTSSGEKKVKVTVGDGVETDTFEWEVFVQKTDTNTANTKEYEVITKVVNHS